MATLPNAASLRVLCIDGGGMKGYTALLILKRVLHAMKVEAKKEGIDLADDPKPCDVFDLIVGTSTGGLIAVMLGRLHMTVDECIEQYEELGKRVFGKTQWAGQTGRFAKGMLNLPFYNVDSLQAAIISVLQLQKVEDQEDFKEKTPVRKTMVCVTRKGSTTAGVLRNYESEHSTQANYKCTIWEAASATAAAPMFFKAVRFKAGGETWCDGGLHRNNPINVALAELQLETDWENKPIGCLLSLGTGAPQIKCVPDNLAKFLKASVDIMTDAETIADEFAMSKDGRELTGTGRYFRFSVVQGMEDLQMDEYKETERMKSLTDRYLGKIGSGNEVDRCAKSLLLPDQYWQEKITDKPKLLPYDKCLHFVERKAYSAELHRFFSPTIHGQRRFVLWGMGGTGKTQIALQYAQSMRRRLSVFWVRADNFANFLNDFSQIVLDNLDSSRTHGSTSQDLHILARNVTARLEKDPDLWLLVLDNADNYNLFVETAGGRSAIISYLPKAGRILITTRDRQFQGTVAPAKDGMPVKPMETREARDLFMKSIPDDLASQSSPTMVDELLDLLGNLPLALAQAAANIADQQRPVQEYIAAYRDKRNRMSLMERPTYDSQTQDLRTSQQSIHVTYEISFESLERHHQSSARCLNYFGFFHWQKIPESCIRALPELRELDDQSFHNTLKHLVHLSMIEPLWSHDGNEYSVHPIIHERIAERLPLEERSSYLSDCVAAMTFMFPRSDERDYYTLCRYLQSHALLQINLAMEILLKSEDLALLNQRCAEFLGRTGMTSDSVKLATQAVTIAQDIWGPRSRASIDFYLTKAFCLFRDARYREAYKESMFAMEVLEIARSDSQAIDDKQYLRLRGIILNYKCNALRETGKLKEAGEISNELMGLRTALPEQIGGSLLDHYNFVVSLVHQGRLQEAQRMNNDLLNSMDEQQRMASRRTYLTIYSWKAVILSKMREGSDVEPAVALADDEERAILQISQEVFEEYRITLPITHGYLWLSCNNLARELHEKGKTVQAARILVSMLRNAAESEISFQGRLVLEFGSTVGIGLEFIESLNETRHARQGPPGLLVANLLVQVIALIDTTPGKLWHVSHTMNNFAILFLRVGDPGRAEHLLREALQDNVLEEDRSFKEGLIHYSLMLAIARQGRIDDAWQYRSTHLTLIAPIESKRAGLAIWLERYREQKELYDKAKRIVTGQDRKVPESWWTEHRVVLNRAQLFYGPLIPRSAEEDSYLFEEPPDLTEKGKERKPRRLGGLIGKLHKASLSSSHS